MSSENGDDDRVRQFAMVLIFRPSTGDLLPCSATTVCDDF
jgi:hypothetical protein